MSSLSTMETLIFLKKVPLFSSFELEELIALKEVTSSRMYSDGQIIIQENDSGNEAFIIVEGFVEIFKANAKDDPPLAVLERTDYFGEMAIIEGEPRSATARARGKCVLLSIDGNQFQQLIKDRADLSFNLVKVFSRRLRQVISKTTQADNEVQDPPIT